MLRCYKITIDPVALGADTISVRDFSGNVFTMPKTSSGPSAGKSEQDIREWREIHLFDFRDLLLQLQDCKIRIPVPVLHQRHTDVEVREY